MVKVRRDLTFEEYLCVCMCYSNRLVDDNAPSRIIRGKYPDIEEITASFNWMGDDNRRHEPYGTAVFEEEKVPFKYIGDPARLSPCDNNGRQDMCLRDEWCMSGKCCGFVDGRCVFHGGCRISNTLIDKDYEDLFEISD